MTERVQEAASHWRADEVQAHDSRDILIDVVRAAHAAGVSEYRLAAAAGVTRQTVRAWLGKGS